MKSQIQVAMISEMIHSASLIHDDVIDQSNFRRGKPSVNVLWNHRKVSNLTVFLSKCLSTLHQYDAVVLRRQSKFFAAFI